MIKIYIGNLGSGKTAMAVREMSLSKINTYSNINTKIKNCIQIKPENIIKKEIIDYKKNKKSGDKEPIYKQTLNTDFWKTMPKPLNVVLDEAHTILNSRRGMTKTNIIISEWLSMLRRILNDSTGKTGDLILISQRLMKLDENARDLATLIQYHVCYWICQCRKCNYSIVENSQQPIHMKECKECHSDDLDKHTYNIVVYQFQDEQLFNLWLFENQETYFDAFVVTDIEDYFKMYDTLQWDNLFSGYY